MMSSGRTRCPLRSRRRRVRIGFRSQNPPADWFPEVVRNQASASFARASDACLRLAGVCPVLADFLHRCFGFSRFDCLFRIRDGDTRLSLNCRNSPLLCGEFISAMTGDAPDVKYRPAARTQSFKRSRTRFCDFWFYDHRHCLSQLLQVCLIGFLHRALRMNSRR